MTIRAREDVLPAVRACGLPDDVAVGIERYIFDRIEAGGFLTAVFEDSLTGAFAKADLGNRALMFEWAGFVYNHMGTGITGTRAIVKRHLAGE